MLTPEEIRQRNQAEFAKSHNQEALSKHWNRVKNHEVTIEDVLFGKKHEKREVKQVLEYDKAREYVLAIIQEYFPHKDGKPTFKTNDQLKKNLVSLTKYFINDQSGDLDPTKGVLLYGSYGTGKTTLFQIFRRLADALDIIPGYDKKFKIVKTSNIVLDVRVKESEGEMRQYFYNNFCFDDLGKEPKEVKLYGNSSTVMGDILFNRYDHNVLTHATTNLSEDELLAHYGERIHSRMCEMFNWVIVDGKDLRK